MILTLRLSAPSILFFAIEKGSAPFVFLI